MTTIAYKNGIIAYDSRVTIGSVITNPNAEKRITVQGVNFFMSGVKADIPRLIDAYFGKVPTSPVDCSALVVHDGKLTRIACDKDGLWTELYDLDNPCAIGSGAFFALTAMDMGASAFEAVGMAALRDTNTGGTVRTYQL